MLYTKDLGIVANKAELAAILQFTGTGDRFSCVAFRVEDGSLLARATNGIAAVYHHSDALDGKGGKCTEEHAWQVGSDFLEFLKKGMRSTDEVVLCVDRKGRLTNAIVRDVESSEASSKSDMAGHVTEQGDLDITDGVPVNPTPAPDALRQVALDPHLLTLVAKVSRACGTGASRWTMPKDERSPVTIEIDNGGNLADEKRAAWIVVVAPMLLGEFDEDNEAFGDAAE